MYGIIYYIGFHLKTLWNICVNDIATIGVMYSLKTYGLSTIETKKITIRKKFITKL